jgi:hypothetical protein
MGGRVVWRKQSPGLFVAGDERKMQPERLSTKGSKNPVFSFLVKIKLYSM